MPKRRRQRGGGPAARRAARGGLDVVGGSGGPVVALAEALGREFAADPRLAAAAELKLRGLEGRTGLLVDLEPDYRAAIVERATGCEFVVRTPGDWVRVRAALLGEAAGGA